MKLDQTQYERFREVAFGLVTVGVAPSVPPPITGTWAQAPTLQQERGHWPGMDGCAWARFEETGRVAFRYCGFAPDAGVQGTRDIGQRVRSHFEAHQFIVIWNGDPGNFIQVVLVPEEGA